MKKQTSIILALLTYISATLSLTSCEKMGENDGVRGFWRLVTVQNGSTETDVAADNIFWGMQNSIISIRSSEISFYSTSNGENCYELIGRYNISGGNLYIEELYYHFDSHDDPIPAITDILSSYGIYTLLPHYATESTGNTLVLTYGTGKLILKKN